MKLEYGKKYVTRSGEVVGPLEYPEGYTGTTYPFYCPDSALTWTKHGDYYTQGHSVCDIVAEAVQDPIPPSVEEDSRARYAVIRSEHYDECSLEDARQLAHRQGAGYHVVKIIETTVTVLEPFA